MQAEWRRAPDFQQFAEALQIDTSQVMGVMKVGQGYGVTWTEPCEGMSLEEMRSVRCFTSILQPDADDILVATSTMPTGRLGVLMDQIDQEMQKGDW